MGEFIIRNGELTRFNGDEAHVVIPDNVTSIGPRAFRYRENLVSVTIPPSVKKIGRFAFNHSDNLTTAIFLDGIKKIPNNAFYGCKNLTSVIIPDSVTEIGKEAFDSTGLESVTIPDSVKKIGKKAFSLSKLTSVTIPDGVKVIRSGAFSHCYGLTSVTIPDSVKVIGPQAFMRCTGLTSINIPDSVRVICASAFEDCTGLTSVTIPKSVIMILANIIEHIMTFGITESRVFWGCINLSSVIIPASVKVINKGAFDNCPNVTVVCPEGSRAHRYCRKYKLSYIYDYQYEAFHGVLPQGFTRLSSPFLADEEKPYIFISYSHKDRDTVLPILKTLYESGWKIWYDEGLTIGDRYDETLEEHVRNCSAFLLFVSENSVNSYYCIENEIPWANEYCKPIIRCNLDEGLDFEIPEGSVVAAVTPADIEPALETISSLSRGERRVAKGINVVVNPIDRDGAYGDGFAYCLYSMENTATVKTIMLEAMNSGCKLYDAVEEGADEEKLDNCACMIIFLDKAFLSDERLTNILTEAYRSGRDMAICQLESISNDDLPQELLGLHKMQWLHYAHGITGDMNTKLVRHLQKRGCRNTAILPGFEYEKTDKGIVITRYYGKEPNLRIESEYGGVPVVKIAKKAFQNCIHVKTLVIADGLSVIGDSAFEGCSGLTSLILPDSVTEIGERAFSNCISLASFTVPPGIREISYHAFDGCKGLAEIKLPYGIEKIGIFAFRYCESLKNCHIPDSVLRISSYAFEYCKSLTSVVLPNGLKEIEEATFCGCASLDNVIIPESVTKIENLDDELSGAFKDCTSLCTIRLPSGLKEIGLGTFFNCKGLKSIVIPESVTEIGEYTFSRCSNLESVVVPDNITKIKFKLFSDCTGLTSVVLPDNVKEIEAGAFLNCSGLTSIVLPDNIKEIGRAAFKGCSELTSINIPDSVRKIRENVFGGCTNITVICSNDSYARRYCEENKIPVQDR